MKNTSQKGDIAVAKTIADLTAKGYNVFLPLSEHLKFDLVCYKDEKFYRIQVKYSAENPHTIRSATNRQNKGTVINKYQDGDFDYYAIYLADKDCVVYPNISFRGATVRTELPELERNGFYWYEDMTGFMDTIERKTRKSFGLQSKFVPRKLETRNIPSKESLEKQVWERPAWLLCDEYGVSDKTIANWCKEYGIKQPPRGYWLKKNKSASIV